MVGRSDAQSPSAQPLLDSKRLELANVAAGMLGSLEARPVRHSPEWSDAAIFAKGLTWALRLRLSVRRPTPLKPTLQATSLYE